MKVKFYVLLLIMGFVMIAKSAEPAIPCNESYAVNDHFISCTSGRGETVQKAKMNAINSAKEEFMMYCTNSLLCSNKSYNMKPLRTHCASNIIMGKEEYNCIMNTEFYVFDSDGNNMSMEVDLNKEINKESDKLQKLREKKYSIERLKNLQIESESLQKEIDNSSTLTLKKTEINTTTSISIDKDIEAEYNKVLSLKEKKNRLPINFYDKDVSTKENIILNCGDMATLTNKDKEKCVKLMQ